MTRVCAPTWTKLSQKKLRPPENFPEAGSTKVSFDGLYRRRADGRIGHARSPCFHVSCKLPLKASIGTYFYSEVVPAGRFVRVANIDSTMVRLDLARIGLTGVGVKDANFLCACAVVLNHKGDPL